MPRNAPCRTARTGICAIVAATLLLAACGSSPPHEDYASQPEPEPAAPTLAPGQFPASLAAFGDGYPQAGDPCRKLGESEATANWLDDKSVLAGCPSRESADRLGGSIVETVEGIFLVSVPVKGKHGGEGDALVPGTDFHAVATIDCAVRDTAPLGECEAGVKREWGPDGSTLVEVTKPDGSKRAIFFDGRMAYGADGAQADGSAGWTFKARRNADESIVTFGPERYVVPDALIFGG